MVCVCHPCSWVIHRAVYWVSCAPLKWLGFAQVLSKMLGYVVFRLVGLLLHGQLKEAEVDRLRVKILFEECCCGMIFIISLCCWLKPTDFVGALLSQRWLINRLISWMVYASNTLALYIFDWLFMYQNLTSFLFLFNWLIFQVQEKLIAHLNNIRGTHVT